MLGNLESDLKKVLLAGIGALATTVEKSKDIVDELVKKGEITVEQGKALNEELKTRHSRTERRKRICCLCSRCHRKTRAFKCRRPCKN